MTDTEHYRGILRSIVAGRPWIVAHDVLVPAGALAEILSDLGASRVCCLAGSRGTGDVPDPERFEQVVLGVEGQGMMDGIRASAAALANLPEEVCAKLDAFDPDREARVLTSMVSTGAPLGGRAQFGGVRPEWKALEDKMIVDELWDRTGVSRAPRRIVDAELSSLRRAAAELDEGLGTVWVGDNKEGFHGGAEYLRWVRDEEHASEAAAFLSEHCDRARVMPFLDGIPCSIHGMVFAETVIAFRPCEMLVFRVPGSCRLGYSGGSTFWDPTREDREEMRRIARAVGVHLRETVDYRGTFTVDGVMTAEGFLPTELNPRFGAALSTVASGLGDLPIYLIHRAVAEDGDHDWRPAELEKLILRAADANRRGGGVRVVEEKVEEQRELTMVCDGETWRSAREGEEADGSLMLGPSPSGGFLRVGFVPERTPIGPSIAPRVAAALRFADEEWDLGIGPLEPAPELRSGGDTG